jgi:GNAT superfamily N-acetyltransferase
VVAEVGDGDVVGLALAGATTSEQTHDPAVAEEFPIDLHSLQVAPEWQRQGVGRKLVAEVARLFSGDGVSGLMVRVLVDNPNVGFYERLGARRIGVQPYDWEGYATEEIVFGWGGLAGFFERSGDVG